MLFRSDKVSLAEGEFVDASRLSSPSQVTDTYLLALAAAHGGRLASMDKRLVVDAVVGGKRLLELI